MGVPAGYPQAVAPPPPMYQQAPPMYQQAPPMYQQAPPAQQFYYVGQHPHQAGMIPPNAVYGDPKGIPLQQTMFKDTPAPFSCVFCGSSGLTVVRSAPPQPMENLI